MTLVPPPLIVGGATDPSLRSGVPSPTLLQHAQEALMLSVALALPIVGVAAIVGILVAAFQAASQIQDPTVAHLPRFLAVAVALVVAGPWIGHQLAVFAEQMFVVAAKH